jgi:hypothetical protein
MAASTGHRADILTGTMSKLNRTACSATVQWLTGCAIGEVRATVVPTVRPADCNAYEMVCGSTATHTAFLG